MKARASLTHEAFVKFVIRSLTVAQRSPAFSMDKRFKDTKSKRKKERDIS